MSAPCQATSSFSINSSATGSTCKELCRTPPELGLETSLHSPAPPECCH